MNQVLRGRTIFGGRARGTVLRSLSSISFFGGVDPKSGRVCEKGHPLFGLSIVGKILTFPGGKGSTVGSYTLYRLAKEGLAPAAIINHECETIVAVGAIIAEIPCLDQIDIKHIPDGAMVEVDAERGTIELLSIEGK